jgi:hypothetical protein
MRLLNRVKKMQKSEMRGEIRVKGIVSRDWRALQIVSLYRYEVENFLD